jgi:hypothetical protein
MFHKQNDRNHEIGEGLERCPMTRQGFMGTRFRREEAGSLTRADRLDTGDSHLEVRDVGKELDR